MEYTVNHNFIKEYAQQLTEKLCRNYFVNKAFISGSEILAFHTENQLNLLIVKNIYLNWQKETAKIKSPYFDFEDESVKQALRVFMNKLSNHIKVYRYDFEPLVSKSIAEYILLAAAPSEFFKAEIEALASPKISTQLLKDFTKYIRVNRFIPEQVIREIEAAGYAETFAGETIRYVRKAIQENPEKADNAESVLSGLLSGHKAASLSDFISMPKPLVTRPAFLDEPKEEVKSVQVTLAESIQENSMISETADTAKPGTEETNLPLEAIAEEIIVDYTGAGVTISDSPISESAPELSPSINQEVLMEDEEDIDGFFRKNPEVLINEKTEASEEFKSETIPLKDTSALLVEDLGSQINTPIPLQEKLLKVETTRQTETLVKPEINTVPFRTLVPMHYRFTFINSLFDGNQDAWTEAVERIDATTSPEEAMEMLSREFADKFNWSMKEDNVAILFNYVERKF